MRRIPRASANRSRATTAIPLRAAAAAHATAAAPAIPQAIAGTAHAVTHATTPVSHAMADSQPAVPGAEAVNTGISSVTDAIASRPMLGQPPPDQYESM